MHGLFSFVLRPEGAGRHRGGNAAAEPEKQRNRYPSGQPQLPHRSVQKAGYTRHIAAVFQKREQKKEQKNQG